MEALRYSIATLGRETLFYGLASVLSRLISLLMLPLLTRHFAVEDYGLFDLFYLSLSLLVTFFLFGQDSAIFRYFFDEETDNSRKQIITDVIVFQLAVIVCVVTVLFVIERYIIEYFDFPNRIIEMIKILILIVPFGFLYTVSEAVLRLTSNLKRYLQLTLGFSCSILASVAYASLIIDANLLTILNIFLYVWILFGLLGLYFVRDWLVLPSRIRLSRKMLSYGIPMGMVVILETCQPVIERLFISNLISLEALGLYAAGAKIVMLIMIPIGAFQMAFQPILMKTYRDQQATKLFNLILTLYVTTLSVCVMVIVGFAQHFVLILAGEGYIGAVDVIFPLAFAAYLNAVGLILGLGTIITNKTYLRFYVQIISQVCCYSFMYWSAGAYGIVGIAVAVFLGKLVFSGFNSYLGQRLYPIAWKYRVVWIMFSVTLVSGSFMWWAGGINTYAEFLMLTSLVTATALLGWRMLNSEEKLALKIF
ncbi:oligosaccharide flippase family protein [Alphaproteobacteria bacterium]|nr:oligosaccharide flippase family protein [Alphaproteobacteria bacterium]